MGHRIIIAIVEDEQGYRDQLAECLQNWIRSNRVQAELHLYANGADFLSQAKSLAPDLVLFDIYMPGMTGIETAERFRQENKSSFIVFCTTSKDQMPEAFAIRAFDYIIKPAVQERIDRIMNDFLDRIPESDHYITLYSNGNEYSILFSELQYVETNRHYLNLTTEAHGVLTVRMTLSALQEMLGNDPRFLIINRGVLVNLDFVASMQGKECRMNDGTSLPIRSRDSSLITQTWRDYCFNKLRNKKKE